MADCSTCTSSSLFIYHNIHNNISTRRIPVHNIRPPHSFYRSSHLYFLETATSPRVLSSGLGLISARGVCATVPLCNAAGVSLSHTVGGMTDPTPPSITRRMRDENFSLDTHVISHIATVYLASYNPCGEGSLMHVEWVYR